MFSRCFRIFEIYIFLCLRLTSSFSLETDSKNSFSRSRCVGSNPGTWTNPPKLRIHEEKTYFLNLIDTPGHVDFTYEVSRSLASCEGALLVVDASQGVEAQTLANVYMALENDLEILPVLNKIDLPHADVDKVKQEIEDVVGVEAMEAPLVSAKSGLGVDELLETIVNTFPAPEGDSENPLQALIFDSWFDS